MNEVWIIDGVRTPRGRGREGGALQPIKPVELVSQLLGALASRQQLDTARVEDVVLGCVTATGDQGTNIAKISALYAGWSERVGGVTLNRFCASGLDAFGYGAARIASGSAELMVVGGVESMSRVPMFADRGAWFSDAEVAQRTRFIHMGVAADLLATLEGTGREQLDRYALRSQRRAARARDSGRFARSLVSVRSPGVAQEKTAPEGEIVLTRDEAIRDDCSLDTLSRLPPAFSELGQKGADALALSRYPQIERVEHHHTVGSSPALADGAALLLLASPEAARELGLSPRARLRAFATHSAEPVLMLDGNVACSELALRRAGLAPAEIDRFEVNESFAAVPLHFQRRLEVDDERLNANGGAIALGHPLGATGGVLLCTLLDELERSGGTLGLATICGGAGVTASTVVERI